jgi:hypothetical protein
MAGRVASRIALAVTGAIPGAAGLVAGHPVLGAALLVACEALVVVGTVAGDVAAELRKRWTDRLVDWIDAAVGRRLAGFDRVYRDKMLSTLRFIDSKGLPTKGFFTPELDEVYVDVKVAPSDPHKVRSDLLAQAPAEVEQRRQVSEFLDQPSPQILAVVGAPGSGKTTLLRHTAKEVFARPRGRRRTVPVLLYLRDHVPQIVQDPDVELPALIRLAVARQGIQDPQGWFAGRLQAGRCLVLFDGLDEVAREKDRRVIAEWVDAQVTRYAKNDFVITSRPAGYRTAEITNAKVLQVCNFNSEQVTRFVRRWYLALENASTKADEDTIRERAREAATDLLDRLDRAPALYELTVNPLLLTMIANVHHHRGALPGSRVDLYSEICQAMLWRRQQAKKLREDVSGEKKEALLRRLAFTMMEREVRDLPRSDVLALVKPALRRLSRELTADDFLADVSSNGLIVERESGLYSFAHLTFQEYLAASHIRDRGLASVLARHVDNVWWRETTLMYAARSDADEIVLACLDSASAPALSLAFDCVDQNSDLDPDLRDQLDELLGTAFAPDTDQEQRRLMTAVVVLRHLRQLARTDAGLVCARPITNRIYRLFLQDTGFPEPDGFDPARPDDDLVVGVRGADAMMFAQWASAITENKTVYRLVTRIQLEHMDVRRAIAAAAPNARECSIWLDPKHDDRPDVPFFWWTAKRSEQYQITSDQLARQVRADISSYLPDLVRILLLRTIIEARDLADKLDVTIKAARERAEAARTSDIGADLAVARARSAMNDGPQTLDRALRQAEFLASSSDLRSAFDATASIVAAVAHAPSYKRADALALGEKITAELVAALDPGLASVLALDNGFDQARRSDQIMGRAFSLSFARLAARGDANTTSWADMFSDEFLRQTGVGDAVYGVPPGELAGKVSKASARLRTKDGGPGDTWCERVVLAMKRTADPIADRKAPMTAGSAAALRLASLCLAGEQIAKDDPELSFVLREIAAGTMVLEGRSSRETPLTETIVLAVP